MHRHKKWKCNLYLGEKMKKITLMNIAVLLIFKISLEISYLTFVNPVYAYDAFYLDYNITKMIISYVYSIIIFVCIIKFITGQRSASQIIIYILLIFLFIPILSLYWLQNQSTAYITYIFVSFLITICISWIFPRVKFPTFKKIEAKYILFLMISILTVLVYGMLIANGGISRINLNLLKVYEARAEYNANTNFMLKYLLSWQANVVNLILLSILLYNKRYKLAFGVLGMQIFLFSMTNFKSYLLAPIVIITFYILQKTSWRDYFLLIITSGTLILVNGSLLLYSISKDFILFPSMFIRRMFFVPAQLHFQYFDFFYNKKKYFLSHSIFEGVIPRPYEENPVVYMAHEFFNKDFAPNVGLWGDAYVNFSYAGIVMFGIILGILMIIIDTCSNKLPLFLTMSILVIPFMSIINSAFFTALLTHGILFSILLLWLVNGLYEGRNKNV